jgi:hypothetical protein
MGETPPAEVKQIALTHRVRHESLRLDWIPVEALFVAIRTFKKEEVNASWQFQETRKRAWSLSTTS